MSQAPKVNEDMQTLCNQLSDANAMLRSQLKSLDVNRRPEPQDSSMRSPDDEILRGELAASLARESVWKSELHTTRVEVQQYVRERSAQRQVSADELCSTREEHLRSTSAYSEARALCYQNIAIKIRSCGNASNHMEGRVPFDDHKRTG